MRPWNATAFVPACPANESLPTITVRVHVRRRAFLRVRATQACPTLRPSRACVNVNETDDCTFRPKENVVPTGGLRLRCLRLILARARPSRQFAAACRAAATIGLGGATTVTAALLATALTSSGRGYVTVTEHASWWPTFATLGVYEGPDVTGTPSSSQV